jgi:hypothetical protein
VEEQLSELRADGVGVWREDRHAPVVLQEAQDPLKHRRAATGSDRGEPLQLPLEGTAATHLYSA